MYLPPSWVAFLAAGLVLASAAAQAPPDPPTVAKECGEPRFGDKPLPNSAAALREHKRVKILAIGASSTAVLGTTRTGRRPLLERILERTIKGLDVEIINRGVSGELAEDAAERIEIEVALEDPDIVLWQVGTNDAFARVPVESFEATVGGTVRWLKDHNVDVILVGLHYNRRLARDAHYQAIRRSLRRVIDAQNVLRIGRYEAMEVLARTAAPSGQPEIEEFGLTEAGYNCMAQYIARTITVGLFARPPRPGVRPFGSDTLKQR